MQFWLESLSPLFFNSSLLAADICQVRADLISSVALAIASVLPSTPEHLRLAAVVDQININTPWGMGGIVNEMLSGVYDWLRIIVAWKVIKFALPLVISGSK